MHAFLVSLGVVGLAELGDKTQLLVLLLAARFRRPVPIIAGIIVGTLACDLLAAVIGRLVADMVAPGVLAWVVGLGFIAMGGWALIPEKDEEGPELGSGRSAFLTTLIAFSVAELGDKTQIAVAGLAARFDMVAPVVAGAALGMLAANVPAVFFGHAFARHLPMKAIRIAAAAAFAGLGIWAIVEGGALFKSA